MCDIGDTVIAGLNFGVFAASAYDIRGNNILADWVSAILLPFLLCTN